MTTLLETVETDIANGKTLSQSLARFPNIFSEFAIHIIESGEESGMLRENLEHLALELRKKSALQQKIIQAFVYPVIVSLAVIGMTVFLMTYLFPKIIPVFASLRMALPFSTRLLVAVSKNASEYGLIALLIFITLIVGYVVAQRKSDRFRLSIHRTSLRLPVIGSAIRSYNMANLTRTLGILVQSGGTLATALPVAVKTSANRAYRIALTGVTEKVSRGATLSSCIQDTEHLFPTTIVQVVAVGEKSGNLGQSLMYLSELCEDEVDSFTKNLSTLIEPLLMIIMGLIVGFIAVSIITPIYGITQNLHQ